MCPLTLSFFVIDLRLYSGDSVTLGRIAVAYRVDSGGGDYLSTECVRINPLTVTRRIHLSSLLAAARPRPTTTRRIRLLQSEFAEIKRK